MGSCEQGKCQQEELFLVCISNYIKIDFKIACISYYSYDFYSNLHNYVLQKNDVNDSVFKQRRESPSHFRKCQL